MSGVSLTSTAASTITTLRPRDTLADALPGPPTARRDFARDDAIVLFAEVYDNRRRAPAASGQTIELVAELHGEGGGVISVASDQRASTAPRRKSGGHGFTLRLPLRDVPPGPYVLHVETRSGEGTARQTASRRIPIRVK